ncbi:MAG TPA: hypothetical protein VIJ50_12150 [Solirubrobacteraceae bacterium]
MSRRSAVSAKKNAPRTVGPLDADVLLTRRSVILTKRRARKLAKPLYINTAASWKDGVAGLAYFSEPLGNRTYLIACATPIEAEYHALLMAMEDAERSELPGAIHFRHGNAKAEQRPAAQTRDHSILKHRLKTMLSRNPAWQLVEVEFKSNRAAGIMAGKKLRGWQNAS